MPQLPSPRSSARLSTIILGLVLSLFVGATTAGCASEETPLRSVHVIGGLDEWSAEITARGASESFAATGYTECVAVAELEGALLCGSSSLIAMNRALIRASLYAEGNFGATRGSVVSTEDPAYRRGLIDARGHDVRSEHLAGFWEDAKRACEQKGPSYCPTPEERTLFEQHVLPLVAKAHPFVVLAIAVQEDRTFLSHELLHAQYFLFDSFRATTDEYWMQEVSSEDKAAARSALRLVYDVSDELLVRNEFMAYVLQPGAERSLLARFVPTHRTRLADRLIANGTPPLYPR